MDRKALKTPPQLSEQYLSHQQKNQLDGILAARKGLLLFAGPTPEDFSSLAYAVIRHVRAETPGRILTVEDAPAWLLKEIDQYHVHPKAGFSRLDAVRSCLHLRPDILYVQNINDPEIIPLLLDAAKNGVWVIGGITAPDAMTALHATTLGLGSVLSAVVHQEMARRLCDHCKEKYALTREEIEELFSFEGNPSVSAWRAVGCPYCGHVGYLGRIGIQELISVNENLRYLISQNAPPEELAAARKNSGFHTKAYDGVKKVLRGLTTFAEIAHLGGP
jgi:type IV pilus assembly protein PilB